jgi:hypothetical protein
MKSGVIIGLLGGAAFVAAIAFMVSKESKASKRAYVRSYDKNSSSWPIIVDHMTDAEIEIVYEFLTKYINKNQAVPQGSTLATEILTIGSKYDIFT